MNSFLVKAECAKPDCNVRSQKDRRLLEYRAYEGELEAHQLVLVPLYAHTQHGACGLKVTLDGASIL
jgi:hypothetical protein